MVQIKNISPHKPKGMILDVDEDVAKRTVSNSEFEYVGKHKEEEVVEDKKPDKSWTEMEIYDWIKKKNIPIKYKPASDTKKYVLDKLESGGYI